MRRITLVLFSLFFVTPAFCESPAADVAQMATIVVSGAQPGPGLWKVSRAGHALWILGTLSPLPKGMHWKSQEIEAVIARSQAVLAAPEVGLDAKLGFFGRLALLPSLIGVRNNPDGARLQAVVPPDLYARWSVLKDTYIGRNGTVERWRPLFAALKLYDAAIDKSGLVDARAMRKTLAAATRRAGLTPTPIRVGIEIDDPKGALKAFKRAPVDDLDCFRKTLDRIDTDLGAMTARANAWATGDLDALRNLPYTDQMTACVAAITQTQAIRAQGVADIDVRVEQAWIDAALAALDENATTFATLPMRHVLGPDTYLDTLRTHGCVVDAPDAADGMP